ncbi:branched-chain amino acid transport system substrate-binding protein [Paenibacillus sp. yr247]|uniref:ABC transporter substrate-binding protein n=1 Tax=Paenibacillus sp. yr247 TaxID=1761880 RepID=UPI000890715B|nr:ABC transporter substrate-binding protein [Paenibacillus sp. yr247]SDO03213.1 branched-chain amino acid transport system substrate-binding protein [Paenibacillus sp. yr247]
MKKKWITATAVMTLAFSSIVGCSNAGSSSGTIKIGANFELSGGVAAFGNSSMKGINLAVKEINAAGGVLGKKIEIVQADNASKPEESTRVAQKLISNDKVVALVGPVTSTNVLAAVPVAMEKKIPLLTASGTNPKVTVDERTNKVNDWVFRACFIDPFQGKVMADFAAKSLSAKTAVVYSDASSDYAKGLAKFFTETFTASGGKVVAAESYQQKDADFKAVLTRIKEKNPDVVFIPGYYEEVGKIVKQARELGIKVPLLGGDGWDAPQLAEIAGAEALNNTFISNHYSADDTSPEVQQFVTAFKKEYNNEVPDAMAVLYYDGLKLIADGLKRAGSTDAEKLKNALAATKDLKLTTGVITLDKNHDPVKSAAVIEFKGGKQVFKTKVNP